MTVRAVGGQARRAVLAREAEILDHSSWLLGEVHAAVRCGYQVALPGREPGTVIVFDSRSLKFLYEDGGRR